MENLSVSKLLIIVIVIIILVPFVYTLPSLWFDYSKTGQIGDTIGGLTSPFINGLTAILVFITFREQVNANRILNEQTTLLRNQEGARNILDQINSIEQDNILFDQLLAKINARIALMDVSRRDSDDYRILMIELNKVYYFLSQFELSKNLISRHEGDSEFLYAKLKYLYRIRFATTLEGIEKKMIATVTQKSPFVASEIVSMMKNLREYFDEPTTSTTTATTTTPT